MTRTELIIQLLKVAIGLAFAAYFVWWSLQVLDRLTPEYEGPPAVVRGIFQFQPVTPASARAGLRADQKTNEHARARHSGTRATSLCKH
jgi:hypothetical protein